MPWAKLPRLIAALLLPLLLLVGAPAQAQTTGSVKGVTIDNGGLEVPGVLVTVASESLIGGAQQQNTDDQGRFYFTKLPPGIYLVRAEMAGFATKEYPNIQVLIGKNVNLTIEMVVQEASMEVIVEEDRPAIDTEQTQRTTVMTEEFLDRVPTGRDYLQAVSAAPGVVGSGNANMAGAAYNENTYMIDGINVTDPVTGTFSMNFNFDAIEQLEVITGAFDAEHSSNLGGIINIVTQTGGNTLEFETNIYYQNGNWAPKMDARYAADGVQLAPTGFDSQFQTYSVGGKISGPIIRDKAWFIISYNMARSLIANVGIDLPRDYEGHYILAKVTTQPSAAHRMTVLFQSDPTTIDNLQQYDRFTKPEAQNRQAQGGFVTSLQWDWFIGPETILETKATYQKSYIETSGVPCTHNEDLGYHPCKPDELENSVDYETPGRLGISNAFNSQNYLFFQFDDRFRYRVESKLQLLQKQVPFLPGTHDFKAGFEANVLRHDRILGYNGNIYYYDLNEVSYDPDTFTNYYWIETTGVVHYRTAGEHYGAFVQDVYKPIDNLTFRYGIRYDRSIQRTDQYEAFINQGVWGPRFYTAWDPWGDEKTKISGGYGRFNAIGNLALGSYLSEWGVGSKLYFGEFFGENGNESQTAYAVWPIENNFSLHTEQTAPHSDEFTVGAERQIIQDLVFGVGFAGKFTRNVITYDETNFIWDEDGFGYVGVGDGENQSQYRMRSPSISRRDYYQTDLQLRKNWSDRWLFQGTYSYVVSRGTVLNAGGGGLSVPPQVEYSYGNLTTDIRHQVKGAAAYDLPFDPWTTTLGAQVQYYSGAPLSRYYYGSGFGSSASILKSDLGTYARTRPTFYIDLQVRQAIDVRKGQFYLVGIVENAINAQNPVGVSGSYIYTQNRWVVTSRQRPTQFQVGAEYKF
jgi:hypothetical protein